MSDLPLPDDSPHRRSRWPWFLAAAVILFIVLAMVWMSFAVKQVERERGANPPPAAPAR
jgi:hypothetical protein